MFCRHLQDIKVIPITNTVPFHIPQAAITGRPYRSNWLLWNREQKAENDPARTSCHNMVIVKFNQLARYLKMQGKPTSWREKLGEESDNSNFRKRLGDFACYLVLVNSLLSR